MRNYWMNILHSKQQGFSANRNIQIYLRDYSYYFIYMHLMTQTQFRQGFTQILDQQMNTLQDRWLSIASAVTEMQVANFTNPYRSMIGSLTYFTEQISKNYLDAILSVLREEYQLPNKIEVPRNQIREINNKSPSQILGVLPGEQQNGDKSILHIQQNQDPLSQSKDLIGNNGEPSIVQQLNIEGEKQQKQIKSCKKVKAITIKYQQKTLRSLYQMMLNDLTEPFENQKSEEVRHLLQFIKQSLESKFIQKNATTEKECFALWKRQKQQQYKGKQFLATEELRQMLLNQFCSEKVKQLRKYLLQNGKGFRIIENVVVRWAFNKLKTKLQRQGYFMKQELDNYQWYKAFKPQNRMKIKFESSQQKNYTSSQFLYMLYNSKLPLTNEERKYFLNTREIKYILNKQKLLGQFEDWWLQLQQLSWNFKQRCFAHKCKIQYLRLNEAQKYKKYLCSHCIQNQGQGPHCQIVCLSHFKPIKYKLQKQQHRTNQSQQGQERQEEQQIFLCEECHLLGQNKYAIVCGLHCRKIVQLCIQQQCVEADEFKLCPKCQQSNGKHNLHKKITFDRGQLMQQFSLKGKAQIDYSKELLKAKEMLQIQPLEKIKKCYAQNILQIMSFLESLTISNNEGLKKWVDLLINQGKKEALTVLIQMMALNQENFSDSEKLSYLEAFNFVLQGELSAMFEGIWQRILHSCERIKKLKNANKSEVIAELNKKYEQISDIETDERVIAFPIKLSDVNPIHCSRIQRITVVKESEEERDDKIRKEFRDKRGKFFKQQIRRKLIEAQVREQQQREIIQLFSKAEESQLGRLADKLKEQNTLYKYRTTIQSLSQTYKQIQKQFTAKLRECLPWSLMVSNEFSSLRVLRIQYAPKFRFDSLLTEEYYYSIDAFALFKFINGSAQLEQVALKGVQISKMQQLVESEWLKARRPLTNLRLTLQSAYHLHLIRGLRDKLDVSPFAFLLSALSYFRRQFQSLSKMTVVIRFKGEDWGDHLEGLLQCLREVKEIKIKIEIYQIHKPSLLRPLLKGLSSFTEITSLAFHNIRLQPQKNGAQFSKKQKQNVDSQDLFGSSVSAADVSAMEESLSLLFKGNTVAHLKLIDCRNFPALPHITTLRQIELFKVSFWGQFVKANRQLRDIRIEPMFEQSKCEIGEETFNQLQCLRGDIRKNGICFGPISSPSPSKLKYLSIINQNQIDANSLKPILAKLANLTQLRLSQFNFGYQLLSAIPSNNLEELSIWGNKTITDIDLQLTDCKWPYLREIKLGNCPQISERMLRLCKFTGLMQIRVDRDVLSWQGRKYLRGRGIRVEWY